MDALNSVSSIPNQGSRVRQRGLGKVADCDVVRRGSLARSCPPTTKLLLTVLFTAILDTSRYFENLWYSDSIAGPIYIGRGTAVDSTMMRLLGLCADVFDVARNSLRQGRFCIQSIVRLSSLLMMFARHLSRIYVKQNHKCWRRHP